MKSCSHPLCCRIRFPLFSEGQRPWKNLCLSRSPEPASSSSSGQGITSQPSLSTQMAKSTKLKWGMERDDGRLQKNAARSWIPLTLYPEEPWEDGRTSLYLPRNYTLQNLQASWISMSCSQKLLAGRRDEQGCWANAALGREKGWEAQLHHGSGRRVLPTAFTTNWWLSERSVKRSFLEAWCYVCCAKSVLLNSFHNKPAPRWFFEH